jgi:hypothetical protein
MTEDEVYRKGVENAEIAGRLMVENASLGRKVTQIETLIRGALAALSQPSTYPVDVEVAKKWISEAIAIAEGK